MFAKIIKILIRTGYFPKSILIFAALLLSAILDVAVISLVGPIIFSSLGGEADISLDMFGIFKWLEDLISLKLVAIMLLLIKITYQILMFKWIYRVSFDLFLTISSEMLRAVFSGKGNNITAGKLTTGITSELEEFVKTVIMPSFQMLSEVTLMVFVLIYLSYLNVMATISLLFFGIFLLGIYRFSISKRLNVLGLTTRSSRSKLIECSQFIAMHKREIKSLDATNHFISQVSGATKKFASASAQYQFFMSLPRLVIELLGLLGLLILGILGSMVNMEGEVLLIFGVASLRMLPALQRIYVSVTQIKYGERTIHFMTSIESYIAEDNANTFAKMINISTATITKIGLALEMTKGVKTYQSEFRYGVNFITGKSGSGKTTVMSSISDYLENSPVNISCSVMHQGTTVFPGSVLDNIALSRDFDKSRLAELLNIFFKAETGRLAPDQILSIPMGDLGKGLSGGQIQRVALVRTLLLDKNLYLIDEGLASLNPALRSQIIRDINAWLMRNNSIAIFVTHETENLSQYTALEID